MDYSALSLLVPIFVIVMVLVTRKVALSLLLGILIGGIIIYYPSPLSILSYSYEKISSVFYSVEEGALAINFGSLYIFAFLIMLGFLSQIMLYSGAINAFVGLARTRVKTPQGSELVSFIAGIIIFIDDYFNALTVGQISKSLNDANKSSRERLAYIIDSTSAPICILVPISSWGAYILGIINANDGLLLLIDSIWSNYYAWFALLGVFLTIIWQINLRPMQKNVNVNVKDVFQDSNTLKQSSIWLLILPILVLIISILLMIFWSGYQGISSKPLTFINILASTDTSLSLFYGGLITLIFSFLISFRFIPFSSYKLIFINGISSMMPAIIILILAWAIGPVIKDDMKTGLYLASLSKEFLSNEFISLLPAILFLFSAFIAFATGTSWGTFAILIPIALDLATSNNGSPSLYISSILAGAVFGDHSSPMSDTTILSATGAGCLVQSHFITQLPYVFSIAFISLLSFIICSFAGIFGGYVFGIISLIALFWFYSKYKSKPLII